MGGNLIGSKLKDRESLADLHAILLLSTGLHALVRWGRKRKGQRGAVKASCVF